MCEYLDSIWRPRLAATPLPFLCLCFFGSKSQEDKKDKKDKDKDKDKKDKKDKEDTSHPWEPPGEITCPIKPQDFCPMESHGIS